MNIDNSLVDAALNALKNEHITKVALIVFRSNDLENKLWSSISFENRDGLIYRNISINEFNVYLNITDPNIIFYERGTL